MDKEAKVREILQRYGFAATAANVWKVQGTPVIYHKVLEQIAIQLKLRWFNPEVIIAERDAAVIKAGAKMPVGDDSREEWAFGEAAIGVNYRVSEKQPAYVYAMAEKRARDRVILRLLELDGTADTDDEPNLNEETEDNKPWLHPAQNTDSGFVKIMRKIHNAQSKPELEEYFNNEHVAAWVLKAAKDDAPAYLAVNNFRIDKIKELEPNQPPAAVDSDPKSLSNLRTLPTRIATMLASVPLRSEIEDAVNGFLTHVGLTWEDVPSNIATELNEIIKKRIGALTERG